MVLLQLNTKIKNSFFGSAEFTSFFLSSPWAAWKVTKVGLGLGLGGGGGENSSAGIASCLLIFSVLG